MSSTKDYYVSVVSDDVFTLSEVGIGTTVVDFYYENNIKTQVTTTGDGSFNYKPITVEVQGIIGVSTLAGQDFNKLLQPSFRGSVINIDITNNGVGYGASTIIDFNRQPFISVSSGSGAELTPVINNGKITDVVINNSGSGYVSPPDLEITSNTGDYRFWFLRSMMGKIVNVVINKSGRLDMTNQPLLRSTHQVKTQSLRLTSMVGTSTCLRRTSIISKMMMVS